MNKDKDNILNKLCFWMQALGSNFKMNLLTTTFPRKYKCCCDLSVEPPGCKLFLAGYLNFLSYKQLSYESCAKKKLALEEMEQVSVSASVRVESRNNHPRSQAHTFK